MLTFSDSKIMQFSVITLACVTLLCTQTTATSWDTWWTYDGLSGPSFWGLMNPQWTTCSKGKRQSPINIDTNRLLFDPSLGDLKIGKQKVNGILQNTGQALVFKVASENKVFVTFGEGPLSYNYQFERINFHYGLNNSLGSEHQINGKSFSGEIQLFGFNKDLYNNMAEAQQKPQGIVVISLMVRIGEFTPELRLLTSALAKVLYKDSSHLISNVTIGSLLPNTHEYLTYEGSSTEPGCWESVIWIIYNKPIYMSVQEMYMIRKLMQGQEVAPKALLGNNVRPIQFSQLTIRTNIKPSHETVANNCSNLYTLTQEPVNGAADDFTLISSK